MSEQYILVRLAESLRQAGFERRHNVEDYVDYERISEPPDHVVERVSWEIGDLKSVSLTSRYVDVGGEENGFRDTDIPLSWRTMDLAEEWFEETRYQLCWQLCSHLRKRMCDEGFTKDMESRPSTSLARDVEMEEGHVTQRISFPGAQHAVVSVVRVSPTGGTMWTREKTFPASPDMTAQVLTWLSELKDTHTPVNEDSMKHEMFFSRVGGFEVDCVALVTFEAEAGNPMQILQRAVTGWVDTTEQGAEVYESSCHDLNIGDLATHDIKGNDLAAWGVRNLTIRTLQSTELNYAYDKHLYQGNQ